MVAVGYSLGLAASVLYLGAVGDRYGRKLLLLIGTGLAIPAALLAAFSPSVEVLFCARILGGLAAGLAFPTTLALITALWSGQARTRSIALWSGLGAAISSLGPLLAGAMLAQFDWGSVFVITLPLAVVALYLAYRYVPAPRQRNHRPGRQPGRHALGADDRGAGAGDQLRPGPRRGRGGVGPRTDRARGRRRVRAAPAPRGGAALRPPCRRPAHVLGRGGRRDHRLRDPDGGDVHRPAVPAERARVLDPQGRHRDHARRALHGRDRPALGEADRGARVAVHPPGGLLLLPARLPDDAPAVGREHPLLGGRTRLPVCRGRRRVRGHPGLPLADRFGPRRARRDGVGHERPAARSRRGDHAVDPRGGPDSRLRRFVSAAIASSPDRTRSPTTSSPSSRSRSRAPPRSPSSTRSTRSRSSPGRAARSSTATIGPIWPGSSRSCSAL